MIICSIFLTDLFFILFSGGRFASFSPCIEQVQKTCTMLRDYGFTDINTCECLQREFAVVHRTMPVLSFDSVSYFTIYFPLLNDIVYDF